VQGMIAATDETAILRTDIVDRDPLKRWGWDRVTLLGDPGRAFCTTTSVVGGCIGWPWSSRRHAVKTRTAAGRRP
jgi:hypothetical protein